MHNKYNHFSITAIKHLEKSTKDKTQIAYMMAYRRIK